MRNDAVPVIVGVVVLLISTGFLMGLAGHDAGRNTACNADCFYHGHSEGRYNAAELHCECMDLVTTENPNE